jgi:N-6 DNA Methylase/Type III restriction enzyme, res subunit
VNAKLFPYLHGFKQKATGPNTVEYKIGEIFGEIKNKIQSGYNLREIIDQIDGLRFRSQTEKHELSHLYEAKIRNMGNAGRNGGEYYTPRPLIRAIVQVVKPQIGERIYDGALGSAGFLCEAFEYLTKKPSLTTKEARTLQERTFYGKEKKSLAYVIAIMNMILHGIEAPNIIHTNTLTENLADIQEKDRYDVVMANPPFGGKERKEVQQNFPNLADQAYNDFTAFAAFHEDALKRIEPDEIRKKGAVPKNASVFFTIFQTFMSGPPKGGQPSPYFGEYPPDFFDFIVIDECHRGGANDEGNWRGILEYFAPAVQLGLTATPKRQENADTYLYFGEPVYIYSLKEGINDGFLTPFRVKQISTTLDEYTYTPDDQVVEGEVEVGETFEEEDFNRVIEIRQREAHRVKLFMEQINQREKTLVFCATQDHALAVRDLINQIKTSTDPYYCQRVTANDGALGEEHLRDFQDNEKTIPTILTTSQKLSTWMPATSATSS